MNKMGFEGRTVTFDWHNQRPEAFGYKFKSKAEYRWAKYLEILKNSNDPLYVWDYEPKTFKAKKMRWNKIRQYTPDFYLHHEVQDSPKKYTTWYEWHEVKTSLTQKDVTRFRWFREDYPDERIVLVLSSQPKKGNQLRLLDNAKKYVDDVIIASPILRKLGI